MARQMQNPMAEAAMGRSFKAIRTRDLPNLFSFFGLTAEREDVEAHRAAIEKRFTLEVQEIVRLGSTLREKERFQLFREALRLSYESAMRHGAA